MLAPNRSLGDYLWEQAVECQKVAERWEEKGRGDLVSGYPPTVRNAFGGRGSNRRMSSRPVPGWSLVLPVGYRDCPVSTWRFLLVAAGSRVSPWVVGWNITVVSLALAGKAVHPWMALTLLPQ